MKVFLGVLLLLSALSLTVRSQSFDGTGRVVAVSNSECPIGMAWRSADESFLLSSMNGNTSISIQTAFVDQMLPTLATTAVNLISDSDPRNFTSGIDLLSSGDIFVVRPDVVLVRTPAFTNLDVAKEYSGVDGSVVATFSLDDFVAPSNSVFGAYFGYTTTSADGRWHFITDAFQQQIIWIDTQNPDSMTNKGVVVTDSILGADTGGGGPDRPPFGAAGLLYFENGLGTPFLLVTVVGGEGTGSPPVTLTPNLVKIELSIGASSVTNASVPFAVSADTGSNAVWDALYPGNPISLVFSDTSVLYMVDRFEKTVFEMSSTNNWDTVVVENYWPTDVAFGNAFDIDIDDRGFFWTLIGDFLAVDTDSGEFFLDCEANVALESANWIVPTPSPSASPSPSPSPSVSPSPTHSFSPSPTPSFSPSPNPSPSPSPSPIPTPSPYPSPSPSPYPTPSPSPTPVEEFNFEQCDVDTEGNCHLASFDNPRVWETTGLIGNNYSSESDIDSLVAKRRVLFIRSDSFADADYQGRVRVEMRVEDPNDKNDCSILSSFGWYELYPTPDGLYCNMRMDIQETCEFVSDDGDVCDFVTENTNYCGSLLHANYLIRFGDIGSLPDSVSTAKLDTCDVFTWGPENNRDTFVEASSSLLSANLVSVFAALVAAFYLL